MMNAPRGLSRRHEIRKCFRRGARLNVSPAVVPRTLQLIEGCIDVPLFRRVKGRLHGLRDCGRQYRPRFGTTNATMSASVTATAIARYGVRRPNVVVHVHALTTRQAIDEVANNVVDVGILDAALGDGYVKSEDLCRVSFGCIMPKGQPNDRLLASLEALNDQTMPNGIGAALRAIDGASVITARCTKSVRHRSAGGINRQK